MGEDDRAEMNEARPRMTRIPKGADLILNKVSGAPGFWFGNVIVMAGVPSIMQAMLDEVALSSRQEFAHSRKPQHGPNTNVVLRARDAEKHALAKRAVEEMLERVRRAQSRS
jgi:molybdopterin-biosynthesis enzyme MoeA-like protein